MPDVTLSFHTKLVVLHHHGDDRIIMSQADRLPADQEAEAARAMGGTFGAVFEYWCQECETSVTVGVSTEAPTSVTIPPPEG